MTKKSILRKEESVKCVQRAEGRLPKMRVANVIWNWCGLAEGKTLYTTVQVETSTF